MKSAVETLTPTRVKLTVEVTSAELKPNLDEAYKAIGAQVNVPGFRRGKVPARIIDQRFGRGAVVQQALDGALPDLYRSAMEENDLTPLGQPELNLTELPLEDGQDLKFEAEVDIVPTFELPDFTGLEVEVDPIEVTEEDVATRLDALRARFGTLVGVDRPAAEGDFLTLDISGTIGEEQIDSAEGVSYEIGSGTMLPGLDEAVIGASAGDTVSFEAPLAGGEHAGEPAQITVVVQTVKERELPEPDDEFAQLASEFDTFAELEADLRVQAEKGARFEQGVKARDKVLAAMLERTDIPVPENLVETEVNSHLEGENRLEDDEHRAEVTESTITAMRSQFLLDALVARSEIEVSQNELVEYIMMTAQQYGMNPNQFAQQIDERGQVPAMVAEVGRRKALAEVLSTAKVTDTEGNEVDLNMGAEDEDGFGDEADAAAEAQAGVQDDADVQTDSDTEGDADSDSDSDTEGDADSDSDSDTEGDADSDSDSDTEGDAESRS